MEWLKRLICRLLGKKPEPKKKFVAPAKEDSYFHRELERVETRIPRDGVPYRLSKPAHRGIQSSDLGMRKLSRHRAGRLHDKRSGFDPNKRMVDIEDDQTRKRKKRTWFEDRKK